MRRPKRRSLHAQVTRMERRWPNLGLEVRPNYLLLWRGMLIGFQRSYDIAVLWRPCDGLPPRVHLIEPALEPRPDCRFIDIPHLMFDRNAPKNSALCLFDPDAGEWNDTMLIADTIIPWAAEWLHDYECWHAFGEWRGRSAPGPQSVGEMLDAATDEEVADGSRS
jgi:hypothetical protein